MSLTNDQIATLKAHALTVPSMVIAINDGDDAAIKNYFNTLTLLYAWKTSVSPDEYLEGITWTEVDGLTASKARIWEWATSNQSRYINFSSPSLRSGLSEAFTQAQAPVTRAGLLDLASRLITKAEELLAVIDGTTGLKVDPRTLSFEGNITLAEASQIRVYGD